MLHMHAHTNTQMCMCAYIHTHTLTHSFTEIVKFSLPYMQITTLKETHQNVNSSSFWVVSDFIFFISTLFSHFPCQAFSFNLFMPSSATKENMILLKLRQAKPQIIQVYF